MPCYSHPVGRSILVQADERLAFTICDNVFVNVLSASPTLTGINDMRRVSKRLWERWQGQFGTLSVLEPMAVANVSDEVRKASDAYTREFVLLGSAIVIEGRGFKGAALRTIIAGMYLIARNAYPHKICSSPGEGASWLAPRLPAGSPSPEEILEAVASTRAAIVRSPAGSSA
jgi:hypothetical protein